MFSFSFLLTNSTTEEAVKAVAGADANRYIPAAFDKYGASSVLSERLSQCLKIVPGLPTTMLDEIRAETYLYAIYRWEDYTDYLQPLVFAVRTNIILATGRDEDGIECERSAPDLV